MKINTTILLKRFVILAIICIILFFVAQSTILPGIVEQIVQHTFQQTGYPIKNISMRSVSWTQADFSELEAGQANELTIDSLQVDYDLLSLLRGCVNNIRVSGAQYTLNWNRQALLTIGHDAFLVSRKNGLPFQELKISSASLLFIRNGVHFRVPFKGWLKRQNDSAAFLADCEILGGYTTLAGKTTSNLKPAQLTVTINGMNIGMLPAAFFPSFFSTPVQGHVQGKINIQRDQPQWQIESDISFRFSGILNEKPFRCDQARLIGKLACCETNGLSSIQADLAMEHALYDDYSINNLAIVTSNSASTLEAVITGNGHEWDFKNTHIQLSNYCSLLPKKYIPVSIPGDPSGIPHLTVNINDYHNRINKVRISIKKAHLTADIMKTDRFPIMRNAALTISSGMLAQGLMQVQGIHGTFHIDEFFPLTTRGSQNITIERASFGDIILNEGNLIFRSETPRRFRIERLDWLWCEGRLSCLPFNFNLDTPETKAAVFFEDVSLKHFLSTILPEKMHGNGHLFGRIPVRMRMTPNMGLTFGKGYLYAVPSQGTVNIFSPDIISEILMGTETHMPTSSNWRKQVANAIKDYPYSLLKISFDRIHENGLSGEITLRGQCDKDQEQPMGLTIPFKVQ